MMLLIKITKKQIDKLLSILKTYFSIVTIPMFSQNLKTKQSKTDQNDNYLFILMYLEL